MSPVAVEQLPAEMRAFIEAYLRHDTETMASLYAPHCTFVFPGIELHGRKEIKGLWEAWFRAFPDITSDVLKAPSAPGVVALVWEERGTHNGRLKLAGFDLQPTGRRFSWRGVSVYESGDEGFEAVTYYVDRLQLPLQLGTIRNVPNLVAGGIRLLRQAR